MSPLFARKLAPGVTVWLFMLQILHGNVAMTALRHVGGVAMRASSYCAARTRLPLALFTQLFDAVAHSIRDSHECHSLKHNARHALPLSSVSVPSADHIP